MEQIIVTHKDGSTLNLQSKTNASKITRCTQTVELLGQDVVDISIESAKKMTFLLGDKITIIGRDYTLNNPSSERKISESLFTYDLQFEGVQYDMLRAAYSVNVDTTSNQIQDINGESLTGDLKRFLDVLISNLNRVFPTKWVLGTYPVTTETRTETFGDTDNCLSVLQSLCSEDKYNTEFQIDIAMNGVRTLNVGAFGTTQAYTFEYGKGKGIYELTRQKTSSSNIVTRLNVFGSSKNIMTSKYRAFKLCLPTKNKAQSYLENASAITKYGVWEGTKNFEDIYPNRESVITALGVSELEFYDTTGGPNAMFDLNERDVDGNTLYLIAGTFAKIHFNTGNLAGYAFEIEKYDHATKKFTIVPQTDENGYTFPSPTTSAFQFAPTDKYVITDIYMPQLYLTIAENALATAGAEYLAKYSQPLVSYGLTVDSFFLRDIVGMEVESNLIWAGDYIPIKDVDLDVDKTIRVKGFTRDLLQDYSYNLSIADLPITVSTVTKIITELKGLDNVVKYNNLNDPARARRNYKATSELVTMIDTLQAEAALIGNDPASQYDLSGVAIRANYNQNANSISISAGTLAHNYYPIGTPGIWTISAGNFASLTPATAYYVYINASKTTATAVYFLSSTKVAVEAIAGRYHFPLGVLSSVIDGARIFSSTKGYTLITGDSIKTGRISSVDGTKYFDLSTGEFKGTFKFASGTDVETAVGDAATAASNASTAASNAQTSANTANSLLSDIASDNKLTAVEKQQTKNEWDSIVSEKTKNDTQADLFAVSKTAYGTAYTALSTYITPLLANLTATSDITGTTFRSTFKAYYDARTDLLNAISAKAKTLADNASTAASTAQTTADGKSKHFTGASTPTTPYVAGRDIWTNGTDLYECVVTKATGAYVSNDFVKATGYDNTQTVIDGGVVTGGTLQVVQGGTVAAGMTGNTAGDTAVRFWAGATLANRATAPFRVLQDGTVVMTKGQMTNADVSGNIVANTGNIGNWEISGGGIFNDTDTAYMIARKQNVGGYVEARVGSNVVSSAAGIEIPAWFMNTVNNPYGDNIALLLSANHGYSNKAIQATGSVVMVCGEAVSTRVNYMPLPARAGVIGNVIYVRNGLRVRVKNTSGATQALYLPSLADIRDDIMSGSFTVLSAAAVSSTTTQEYYIPKGSSVYVGDVIKYGTSDYKQVLKLDTYISGSYDIMTLELTLGVAVANGGTFTVLHAFSIEFTITGESNEAVNLVNVYPNGSNWYNNDGALLSSVALGRGDVIKVIAYSIREVMAYQLIHYKTS